MPYKCALGITPKYCEFCTAELPKCVCPVINTDGTGRNGTDCNNKVVGEICTMTCQGVLNRTRTVDGKLQCQLNGFFKQITAGPAVPDPNKVKAGLPPPASLCQ